MATELVYARKHCLVKTEKGRKIPFHFLPYGSVMAIGNPATPTRHLHELQQTSESSQCGMESEFGHAKSKERDSSSGWHNQTPIAGELAKGLDISTLGDCHVYTFYMEVLTV